MAPVPGYDVDVGTNLTHYTKDQAGSDETTCVVCQETLGDGERILRVNACEHEYHQSCIGERVAQAQLYKAEFNERKYLERAQECPNCRGRIDVTEVEKFEITPAQKSKWLEHYRTEHANLFVGYRENYDRDEANDDLEEKWRTRLSKFTVSQDRFDSLMEDITSEFFEPRPESFLLAIDKKRYEKNIPFPTNTCDVHEDAADEEKILIRGLVEDVNQRMKTFQYIYFWVSPNETLASVLRIWCYILWRRAHESVPDYALPHDKIKTFDTREVLMPWTKKISEHGLRHGSSIALTNG